MNGSKLENIRDGSKLEDVKKWFKIKHMYIEKLFLRFGRFKIANNLIVNNNSKSDHISEAVLADLHDINSGAMNSTVPCTRYE